jgi:hypothetical protein
MAGGAAVVDWGALPVEAMTLNAGLAVHTDELVILLAGKVELLAAAPAPPRDAPAPLWVDCSCCTQVGDTSTARSRSCIIQHAQHEQLERHEQPVGAGVMPTARRSTAQHGAAQVFKQTGARSDHAIGLLLKGVVAQLMS